MSEVTIKEKKLEITRSIKEIYFNDLKGLVTLCDAEELIAQPGIDNVKRILIGELRRRIDLFLTEEPLKAQLNLLSNSIFVTLGLRIDLAVVKDFSGTDHHQLHWFLMRKDATYQEEFFENYHLLNPMIEKLCRTYGLIFMPNSTLDKTKEVA